MDPYIFDTYAVLNFGQHGHLQSLLTRFGRIYQLLITPDLVGELTDPHHKSFNDVFVPAHFTIQSPKTTAFDLETLTRFAVMLGPGEISVMALAKELQATAVLDERAARADAVARVIETAEFGDLHRLRQVEVQTESAAVRLVARRARRHAYAVVSGPGLKSKPALNVPLLHEESSKAVPPRHPFATGADGMRNLSGAFVPTSGSALCVDPNPVPNDTPANCCP